MPSFSKLLVANRGEIAARIVRTARDLGYATVAVYSDADADGLVAALADEAVHIGPAVVAESYLNTEAILEAAARSGADAIHPGYGFLSENADFARACTDAGLVFVGPPPAAIEAMGDTAQAKARMEAAGVPTVPGLRGELSVERVAAAAEEIGYPVLLKAVAGGGGRGMRRVDAPEGLATAMASAAAEARGAFGDGTLLLEKLVEDARHVEIQVFADAHGQVVHLGERDCSAQRRHQKIIEEAPCPAVDAALRERMGAAAVAAAAAIGYVGAGTVEFLLAADGSFYFLEMNTRLQVEHPVTELVTGLDLVAWQLQVAAGEALALSQAQVELRGHAIEARLYAEDPAAGFMPQTGAILAWSPAEGEGLRVDHGLLVGEARGQRIGSDYDPMVAKLIAHGATREQARRRLIAGLRDSVLLGPRHNKRLLLELLASETFIAGQVTTGFVEGEASATASSDTWGTWGRRAEPTAGAWAVAAALIVEAARNPSHARPGLPVGWRSAAGSASVVELRCGEAQARIEFAAEPCATGVRWRLTVHAGEAPGVELGVELLAREGPRQRVDVDGHRRWIHAAWSELSELELELEGDRFSFARRDLTAERGADASAHDGLVRAPTLGRVLAVDVEPGQTVSAGQRLLTLEAMKIESAITAPSAGVVAELRTAAGEQVEDRQVLVVLTLHPQSQSKSQSKPSPAQTSPAHD